MRHCPPFAFETCLTVSGTVWTARPDALAAALRARFPVEPGDPEREFQCDPAPPDTAPPTDVRDSVRAGQQPVTCWIRHDAPIDPADLARCVCATCPDCVGVLNVLFPYAEVGRRDYGAQLVFRPEGVAVHRWVLAPEPRPSRVIGREASRAAAPGR